MGVITDLFERRSGMANPAKWLSDWTHGGEADVSGIRITQDSALKHSAVWCAVDLIARTIGTLPLRVYEHLPNGGKEKRPVSSLDRLLHYRTNPHMDAQIFRQTLQAHVLMYGNGYAEIQRDNAQRIAALWPMHPGRVSPEVTSGNELWYVIRLPDGQDRRLPAAQVFHLSGLGFDGYQGYSVINYARQSLSVGLAAEKFGAAFFGKGARPGGVLEHPGEVTDRAAGRLQEDWEKMHQGLEHAHRVALLEEGMKYHEIGIPPEDAQFLETRRFGVQDVARWFHVPPHKLADMERATFSNIEHQGIEFVTDCLLGWLRMWEGECNYKLFGVDARYKQFAEFVVEGLLRGDITSRYRAYATGRQWGWMSANDVRAKENMNPIAEGGDVYLSPANMLPSDQVGKTPPQEKKPAEEPTTKSQPFRRLVGPHEIVWIDAAQRMIRKEAKAAKQHAKKNASSFVAWIEKWYAEHTQTFRAALIPAVESHVDACRALGTLEMSPEWVGDYTRAMTERHIGRSRDELLRVAAGADDLSSAVGALVSGWEASRAEEFAETELTILDELIQGTEPPDRSL